MCGSREPFVMDIPPAVDSLNNILNALDNYCIQAIFSHLETRKNFYNVARTCTRFQANAIRCFPSELCVITIGVPRVKTENVIPTQLSCGFLGIFGHLIKEIHWFASGDPANDRKILETIGQFCGKTLNGFNIRNYNLRFPKKCNFTALEKLTLDDASAKKFKYHSNLKYLSQIKRNNGPDDLRGALRIRKYPHLEHLYLNRIGTLTYDKFIRFLVLNPQLKKLDVIRCKNINSSVIRDISNYLPNIERFGFFHSNAIIDPLPYSDWMHLSRLRNLKSFEMLANISFKLLVDLFCEFNLPVEHLSLVLIRDKPPHDYEHAQKLKSLKRMDVWNSDPVSLLRLIKTQPSLEEITLGCFSGYYVNKDLFKEVFLHGNNLTKLSIVYSNENTLDVTLDKQVIALDCGRVVNVEVDRNPELIYDLQRWPTRIEFSYICRLQSTQS